jgi:hypothetical protein
MMSKQQIVDCDFSTEKEKGFFWMANHQTVATATLYPGLIAFQGSKYRIHVENVGTPKEKVTVVDLDDCV